MRQGTFYSLETLSDSTDRHQKPNQQIGDKLSGQLSVGWARPADSLERVSPTGPEAARLRQSRAWIILRARTEPPQPRMPRATA